MQGAGAMASTEVSKRRQIHGVFSALGPTVDAAGEDPRNKLVCELNHKVSNEVDAAFIIGFFSTMVVPDDLVKST